MAKVREGGCAGVELASWAGDSLRSIPSWGAGRRLETFGPKSSRLSSGRQSNAALGRLSACGPFSNAETSWSHKSPLCLSRYPSPGVLLPQKQRSIRVTDSTTLGLCIPVTRMRDCFCPAEADCPKPGPHDVVPLILQHVGQWQLSRFPLLTPLAAAPNLAFHLIQTSIQ